MSKKKSKLPLNVKLSITQAALSFISFVAILLYAILYS